MRLKAIHVAADDDVEEYYVVVGELTADDDNDYGFSIQVVQEDVEAEVFFRRAEFRELRDAINELLAADDPPPQGHPGPPVWWEDTI